MKKIRIMYNSQKTIHFLDQILWRTTCFVSVFSPLEILKREQRKDPISKDIIATLLGKDSEATSTISALKLYCLKDGVLDRKQKHPQHRIFYYVFLRHYQVNGLIIFIKTHQQDTQALQNFTERTCKNIRMKYFLGYKIRACSIIYLRSFQQRKKPNCYTILLEK